MIRHSDDMHHNMAKVREEAKKNTFKNEYVTTFVPQKSEAALLDNFIFHRLQSTFLFTYTSI